MHWGDGGIIEKYTREQKKGVLCIWLYVCGCVVCVCGCVMLRMWLFCVYFNGFSFMVFSLISSAFSETLFAI